LVDKHIVRFEPVGIDLEVREDQNVLRAAAEQGIMLMHGCKEGQCAACKSFLLEGDDVEHEKYSTFALPDYEREEGFTLLCRAHVYEDVTIELLNYDEEMIRSGLPIVEATAEVVTLEKVTHDLRHLVLRLIDPSEIRFFPGQYVDIALPGTDLTRSFSMANITTRDGGLLEFVIKVYPEVDLIFVGGGAGMAPILSLLRAMKDRAIERKATFYYGARTVADLCFVDELRELETSLPGFRFVPAISEPAEGDGWDGETGFVTDVVKAHESDLAKAHAYVCGPPPMVEAAQVVLGNLGVPEKRIYFDKFTTTGDPEGP
jgi:propane monooxygenase reductase subunit